MNKSTAGFTLIEVLIALAILAIALVAIIKVSGQSIEESYAIKQKLAAHWVAMNALARVQTGLVDLAKDSNPSGDESMLGENWLWKIAVDPEAVSSSYARVTVTVSKKDQDQNLETLQGFVRFQHD